MIYAVNVVKKNGQDMLFFFENSRKQAEFMEYAESQPEVWDVVQLKGTISMKESKAKLHNFLKGE